MKKFAEAIQGVVPLVKTVPETKIFDEEYSDYYTKKMRKKVRGPGVFLENIFAT